MRISIRRLFQTSIISIIYISILILVFTLVMVPRGRIKDGEQKETSDVSYNSEMDKNIESLFKGKNKAVLQGDKKLLESIYNMEDNLGIWAYENEIRKINYINDWSNKQGVEFTEINPTIVIKNIKKKGEKFSVNLLCSTEYKYKYKDEETINISRVGTHHIMDLIEKDEKLIILKEWYDDPFASSLDSESFNDKEIKDYISNSKSIEKKVISKARKSAVSYAHKYSGAASEEKYGFKYNNKFKNYNGEGGDCTNFISQVLLEGDFKKDSTWNYDSSGASKAWVNAESFKQYLTYSSKGRVLSSGSYKDVYKNSYNLNLGDVISYEEDGKISHTALVTGFDSKGYPLITCHNTDRNNVPFDIGFNSGNIKFHLIGMNY